MKPVKKHFVYKYKLRLAFLNLVIYPHRICIVSCGRNPQPPRQKIWGKAAGDEWSPPPGEVGGAQTVPQEAIRLACSRRSDSRRREKNSRRKKKGRLEG